MERKKMSADEIERYVLGHMKEAIEKDWIYAVYQPIVRTVSRRVCGAEALARWQDPEIGYLTPGEFIPVLEKYNLIATLDLCIFERVARDIAQLREWKLPVVTISINVSRSDFKDPQLLQKLERIVDHYRVPKKYLRFEVTANAFEGKSDMAGIMQQIKDAGYEIWMDNFGGGPSSTGALMEYDFRVIKYDMRFLRGNNNQERWERGKSTINYIVNMAKDLGVGTLAESVETEEEFDYLRSIGCSRAQGYFISKPLTLDEYLDRGFSIEEEEEEAYYDEIGNIKIENNEGLRKGRTAKHVDPMAVMEYRDHRYYYLYENDAHAEYMKMLGLEDREAWEQFFNQPAGIFQEKLRIFVQKIMHGDKEVRLSFTLHGFFVDMWADYVATNPKNGAIALTIYNTALTDRGRDRMRDLERAMDMIYNIFDRIDLIRAADGVIMNSYLNTAEYGGIHEGMRMDAVTARFADHSIGERDREKYCRFVDRSTVAQRLYSSGKSYLTECVEFIMDDGVHVEKQIVLVPFEEGEQEMLLLGILNLPVTREQDDRVTGDR